MHVPPFSRRVTTPQGTSAYSGDAALLFVMPTNMVNVTTEEVVGVFQGSSMQEKPGYVTIDFFLNDPTPFLPQAQGEWDGTAWVSAAVTPRPEKWLVYDQANAEVVKAWMEASHQFTIPTNGNILGVSDDLVRVEYYKWVAIRVAYATDPAADVYVQITPQTIPEVV